MSASARPMDIADVTPGGQRRRLHQLLETRAWVTEDAPHGRGAAHAVRTDVAQIRVEGIDQLLPGGMTVKQEQVDASALVGLQFRRRDENCGVPTNCRPSVPADITEPAFVRRPLRCRASSVHRSRSMDDVAEIFDRSPQGPAGDVLIQVELRRCGPGGRGRRFEPGISRCRTPRQRPRRPLRLSALQRRPRGEVLMLRTAAARMQRLGRR